MGLKPSETGPIAGEPALTKHIGYALDLVSKLLDMMDFPEDYHIDGETVDENDLVKLQHHLVNAKYAAHATHRLCVPVAALATEKIDEDDGSCEGEMQAEAEAERQADAALELSAELASCDWESWE